MRVSDERFVSARPQNHSGSSAIGPPAEVAKTGHRAASGGPMVLFSSVAACGVLRPRSLTRNRRSVSPSFVHSGSPWMIVICWCQGRVRGIQLARCARERCKGDARSRHARSAGDARAERGRAGRMWARTVTGARPANTCPRETARGRRRPAAMDDAGRCLGS